ncbi:hypothetical protein BJX63DRAFT_154409 [Aspergillus granulosus]|uniref:Uncharacterized protein n=1 Tax=Aspergillus granulosus TaxID=176169 RepID=A0ABR4HKI6_9EURO
MRYAGLLDRCFTTPITICNIGYPYLRERIVHPFALLHGLRFSRSSHNIPGIISTTLFGLLSLSLFSSNPLRTRNPPLLHIHPKRLGIPTPPLEPTT